MRSIKLSLCIFFIALTLPLNTFANDLTKNPLRQGRIITDLDISLATGSVEADDTLSTDIDSDSYRVDVVASYTVIDNLALGIGVLWDYSNLETKNQYFNSEVKDQTFMLTAVGRYFFMESSQLRPFVGIQGGIGKSSSEVDDVDMDHDVYMLGGSAGVAYFFNDNVAIDLTCQYSKTWFKDSDNYEYTEDMDGSDFLIGIGLMYAF